MRIISNFLLTIQILLPLLTSINSIASAVKFDVEAIKNREALSNVKSSLPELTSQLESDDSENSSGEEKLASGLSQTAQIISDDDSRNAAKSWLENSAYGYLNSQMQSWLNQYGNSSIQVGSQGFNAELLLPLFENSNHLVFSQSRINRESDDKKIINLGVGYRHFSDDWMWGINSFFDHDLKNNNARWGAGFELGADYIKLSTNGYWRLTNWRQSKLAEFSDYYERPANGFDIRAEGFLPNYPNIGANFVYEKYFGEDVNLRGTDSLSDLKDNPEAYSLGLSYTPVSLFTFKLNKIMGDSNETIGAFELNYRLGVPISQQLDSNFVPEIRTLKGARYDFVNRNNAIVMQYQKQATLRISLPKTLAITATQPAALTPTITQNEYEIDHVEWSAPSITAKGGTLIPSPSEPYAVTITMPFYDYISPLKGNSHNISAVAVDVKGNRSNAATTNIIVSRMPIIEIISNVYVSPNPIIANGETAGIVTALVKDTYTGQELVDVAVDFTVVSNNGEAISGLKLDGNEETTLTRVSDSKGVVSFPITGIKSGEYTLNVSIEGREPSSTSFSLVADNSTSQITDGDIIVIDNGAIANGVSTNSVQVRITDANGNVVINQPVSFTADNGATIIDTVMTDENGIALATLTNNTAGNSVVNVIIGNSNYNVTVNFIADSRAAKLAEGSLKVVTDNQPANGDAANTVQVMVTDPKGNAVAGQTVSFTANNADITKTAITNTDGIVLVEVKSKTVGKISVEASLTNELGEKSTDKTDVNFVIPGQIEEGSVRIENNGTFANDFDKVTLIVTVKDGNNNPAPNQDVFFGANDIAALKFDKKATTNIDGIATVTITSTVASSYPIDITVGESKQIAVINFIADPKTAELFDNALTVIINNQPANGQDPNILSVIVGDRFGNAIPNYNVLFRMDDDEPNDVNATTDEFGVAVAKFTSKVKGLYTITSSIKTDSDLMVSQEKEVVFVVAAEIKDKHIVVTPDMAIANGEDKFTIDVTVTDGNGKLVPNQEVFFAAKDSTIKFNKKSAITNSAGIATVTLTSKKAGHFDATASVDSLAQEFDLNFIADRQTAKFAEGSFKVLTTNQLANGEDSHIVQVAVIDENENIVRSHKVLFDAGDIALISGKKTTEVLTDDKGIASVALTSTTVGESKVTASIVDTKGESSKVEKEIKFVVVAEIKDGNIVASPKEPVVATGNELVTIDVTVTDGNGNLAPKQKVLFSAGENAIISADSTTKIKSKEVITDERGIATITVGSTVAGSYNIKATVRDSQQTVPVTFIADSSTAKLVSGSMIAEPTNQLANGQSAIMVKVNVVDEQGNAVPNYDVSFSGSSDVLEFDKTATTNDKGIAFITVTSTIAGNYDIKATTGGAHETVSVTFIADPDTATLVEGSMIVAPNNRVANGQDVNIITVMVKDKYGNPVPNYDVTFDGPKVNRIVATNTDGIATLSVTSKKAGNYDLIATVGESQQTAVVSFIADKQTAKLAENSLKVLTTNQLANGQDNHIVQVTVVDGNKNLVIGQTVQFNAGDIALISGQKTTEVTTDENGIATVMLTSTTVGDSTVTALMMNANGESSKAETDIKFVVVAEIKDGNMTASPKEPSAANGNDLVTIDVTVTDGNGKLVPKEKVLFSAGAANIIVSENSNRVKTKEVITDESGIATITVSSTVAGSFNIKATVRDSQQTVPVIFIADRSTAKLLNGSMKAEPTNQTANGQSAISVTIKVIDEQGNAIPSYDVSFNGSSDALKFDKTAATNAEGIATITLTSSVAGNYDINATIDGSDETVPVTFIADRSTAKLVIGSLTAQPSNQIANGEDAITVTVKVVDEKGNAVPSYDVSFSGSNDALEFDKTATTNAEGIATITVTAIVAASYNIKATIGGPDETVPVTFIADKTTAKLVDGSMAVNPNNQAANGQDHDIVTVMVKDKHGNVVPDYDVLFNATDDAIKFNNVATTNLDGIATLTVTSKKAGSYDITATVGESHQTAGVNFVADERTAKFEQGSLKVLTTNQLANDKDSHNVQVTVIDENENLVIGQTVRFDAGEIAFILDDNKSKVKTLEVVTGENGIATVKLISDTVGSSTVIASMVNKSGKSNSDKANITFVVVAEIKDSNIKVKPNVAAASGNEMIAVEVTVTDGNGKLVPKHKVLFDAGNYAIIAGENASKVKTTEILTNEKGVANIALTTTVANSYDIKATVLESHQTATVKFIGDIETAHIRVDDLSIERDNAVANDIATNMVKVKIVDAHNNPIPDAEVKLALEYDEDEDYVTIGTIDKTNDVGEVQITLKSTKAGIYKIIATVFDGAGTASKQEENITFIADQETAELAKNALIVVTKGENKVANGTEFHEVQVTVTDKNGNGVPQQQILFSVTNGAVIEPEAETNENGIAKVKVTSEVASSYDVTATFGEAHQTVSLAFIADRTTANLVSGSVKAEPTNQLANGQDEIIVTVEVADEKGNVVPNYDVSFSGSSDALKFNKIATTNEKGIASIAVTSSVADNYNIKATVKESVQSVPVTFIADSSTAKLVNASIKTEPTSQVANGQDTIIVTVEVVDGKGNVVPNYAVSFSGSNNALKFDQTANTDAKGIATIAVTSIVAGSYNMKATVKDSEQTVPVTFIADSSTAKLVNASIKAEPTSQVANGQDAITVTVAVIDENGNVMPDYDVSFTGSNDALEFNQTATTSDEGIATIAVKSSLAGSYNIKATVRESEQTVAVSFTADRNTAKIVKGSMVVSPNNQPSNGQDTNVVMVNVVDAKDNPVADYSVLFTTDDDDTDPASFTSDKKGIVRAPYTSTVVKSFKVTATATSVLGGLSSDKGQVTFVADDNTAKVVEGSMKAEPTSQLANGQNTIVVTVKVVDENGNVVPNHNISFSSSSDDLELEYTAITSDKGIATIKVTSTIAGFYDITAMVGGSSETVLVTFVADNSTAKLVEGSMAVAQNNQPANGQDADIVTVTVIDAKGNTIPNYSVSFSATDSKIKFDKTAITNDKGIATVNVTSNTAGSFDISAIIGESRQTVSAIFVADEHTAKFAENSLKVLTGNQLANGQDSHIVQVTVVDENKNVVMGQKVIFDAGDIALISGNKTAEVTTDENGIATVKLTSTMVGESTVTASMLNAKEGASKAEQNITFVVVAEIKKDNVSVSPNGPDFAAANDDEKAVVKVIVTDGNGKLVGKEKVLFDAGNHAIIVGENRAKTKTQEVITDEKGVATIKVSSAVANTYDVKATVKESYQIATVKFIGDIETAQIRVDDLSIERNNAVANDIATNLVKVTIVDSNQNAVPNAEVKLALKNESDKEYVTIGTIEKTNDKGEVFITLTSKKSGAYKVLASVNNSEQEKDVIFIADEQTAELTTNALTVLTNNQLANGTDFHEVQVMVTDKNGNGVPEQQILFAANNGATIEPKATTNEKGIATAKLTSLTVGDSTVTATIVNAKGEFSKAEKDVRFVVVAEIKDGNMTVSPKEPVVANGKDRATIDVTVTDGNGNLVPEQKVLFTTDEDVIVVNGHNSGVKSAEVMTNAKGIATITVTTSTVARSYDIKAAVGTSVRKATVTFIGDIETARIRVEDFSVERNNAVANDIATNLVKVKIVDSNLNAVPNADVTLELESNDDKRYVTIGKIDKTNDKGEVLVTLTSNKAATYMVIATVIDALGQPSRQGKDITFIADQQTAELAKDALTVLTKDESKSANGTDFHEVQVKVTDKNGNGVADQKITFTVTNGATIKAEAKTTNAEGIITAKVTSKVAQSYDITATFGESAKTATVTFSADKHTAQFKDGKLNVLTTQAQLANGVDSHIVQVTVIDENNNPIIAQKVVFDAGDIALISGSRTAEVITGENGIAAVNLTSTAVGNSTVTASIVNAKEEPIEVKEEVKFVVVAEITDSNMTIDPKEPNFAVATGDEKVTVKVIVTDGNGKRVPDQLVLFSGSNDDLKFDKTSVTTDAQGIATVTVTSVVASRYDITATVRESHPTKSVTFIADKKTAEIVVGSMNVEPNNQLANGRDANIVSVKVVDDQNNVVPNYGVLFNINNDAIDSEIFTTDDKGIARVSYTSTVAKSYKVTATLTNSSGIPSKIQRDDVTFIADNSSAKLVDGSMTVTTNNQPANGQDAHIVTVTVKDQYGNLVPNYEVVFSATDEALKFDRTVKTNEQGLATVKVTSEVVGSYDITATLGQLHQTKTIKFVVPAEIKDGNMTVSPNSADFALANGKEQVTIKVTVTDGNNDVVPNYNVSFSSIDDAIEFDQTATTNADGVATIIATSEVANSYQVIATVGESQRTAIAKFVVAAEIKDGNMTVTPKEPVANGKDRATVDVTVTDGNGKLLPAQKVLFTANDNVIVANGNTSGAKTAEVVTNAKGIATIMVTTSTIAKSYDIKATVATSTKKATVTFIGDIETAHIRVEDFSVERNGAVADDTASNLVKVRIVDNNQNVVPNADVVLALESDSDKQHVTIGKIEKTDDKGEVRIALTSKQAGTYKIVATVIDAAGTVSKQYQQLTFTADEDTADLAEDALSVITNNQPANGDAANIVQVKVSDKNGNGVPDKKITLTVTNGATIEPEGTTNADGIVTAHITSKVAKSYKVTATFGESSKTATVTFVADKGTLQFKDDKLNVLTTNQLANGEDSHTVQVTVLDENKNLAMGQTVLFDAGDIALISGKKTAEVTTDKNGIATVKLTSEVVGDSIVTASLVNDKGDLIEVKDSVKFVVVAEGSIDVAPEGAVAANGKDKVTITVMVQDGNGKRVPEQKVSFNAGESAIISSKNLSNVKVAEINTDVNGIATITIASTEAKSYDIDVAVRDLKQTVKAVFVADATTAVIVKGSMEVNPNNQPANGKDANVVMVKVVDANNNPMVDSAVLFMREDNASEQASIKTDENGIAKLPYTSTEAKSYVVIASVTNSLRGLSSYKETMTFIADKSTAKPVDGSMKVERNNQPANGQDANRVTVQVVDANNNIVPNYAVSFTASNDAVKFDQIATTNEQGIATLMLTSLVAGSYDITATVEQLSQTVPVTFIADSKTAKLAEGSITVTTNNQPANGQDADVIAVTVIDEQGNAVPNYEVVFSSANEAIKFDKVVTTNADGVATLNVTTNVAGSYNVTAAVGESHQTESVVFVADKHTAKFLDNSLTVLTTNQLANGQDSHIVEVTVVDENNNRVIGQKVVFDAGRIALIAGRKTAEVMTDENGIATVTLTSTTVGDSTVTASMTVADRPISVSNDVKFVVLAEIKDQDITVEPKEPVANGKDQATVTVKVTDGNGKRVPEQKVLFSADDRVIVANGNSAGAKTAEIITNAEGIATIMVTTTTVAKSYDIKATVATSTKTATVTFIGDVETAHIRVEDFSVERNGAVANDMASNLVKVTIVDTNLNPVPDADVVLALEFEDDKQYVTIGKIDKTDNKGEVHIALTSKQAGTYGIIATVIDASGAVSRQRQQISFIADEKTAELTEDALLVLTNNQPANGEAANLVQLKVTDKLGNGVPDQKITFSVENGATIETEVTTNAEGIAIAKVTSKVAKRYGVTATFGESVKKDTVTFIADKETAEASLNVLTKDTAMLANGEDSHIVKVTVVDENNNPVAEQTVQVDTGDDAIILAENNAKVKSLTVITDENGIATITTATTVAKSYTITATVRESHSTTASVTFIADKNSAKIVSGSIKVEPNNQLANGKDANVVTVTVKDQYDNLLADYGVFFTKDDGEAKEEVIKTNKDGIASALYTSTKAQTYKVMTSIMNALEQYTTDKVEITFIADKSSAKFKDANLDVLTAKAQWADGEKSHIVQAMVVDANGNPIKGQTVLFDAGKIALISGNKTAEVQTDENGIAKVNLTSTTIGESTVTASMNVNGQLSSVDANISFIAGAEINEVKVSPELPALANGKDTITISINVKDGNRDVIPNQKVLFDAGENAILPAEDNTKVKTLEVSTNAEGIAIIKLTSKVVKSYNITATVGASSKTFSATFVAAAEINSISAINSVNNNGTDEPAKANGADKITIQAKVTDGNGILLAGQNVLFSTGGYAIISGKNNVKVNTLEATTNDEGIAVITITSTETTQYNITATVGEYSKMVQVKFLLDLDVGLSKFDFSLPRIVNNSGKSSDGKTVLTMLLKDSKNNPITGISKSITLDLDNKADLNISELKETANKPGEYTATVSSAKVNKYEISVLFNGTKLVKLKDLDVYTYKLQLSPENKKLGKGMRYEYYLSLVESDTGTEVVGYESTKNSLFTWSSSSSAAKFASTGIVTGVSIASNITITAKLNSSYTYNNVAITGSTTTKLNVTALYEREEAIRGDQQGNKSELFLIDPPDYVLNTRGDQIVDSIGKVGSQVHGKAHPIAHTNKVTKITGKTCRYAVTAGKVWVISELTFYYSDGTAPEIVGVSGRCTDTKPLEDFVVPSGEQLVGFAAWETARGNFIAGVQFITADQ
ncbi:Ig-like domain-containing protein [Orbus sturtevantii]|uniref:Ig-like domain-containing protein n=1 Tax=Orbus sturtevantii TaxID=3074109 RepID=UPI00370D47BF